MLTAGARARGSCAHNRAQLRGVEPPPLSEPDLIDLNDLQALILPSTAKIFVPAPSFSEAVRAALVDYSDNSDISEKKAKILVYGSKWVFFSEKNTHSSFYRSFWVLNSL